MCEIQCVQKSKPSRFAALHVEIHLKVAIRDMQNVNVVQLNDLKLSRKNNGQAVWRNIFQHQTDLVCDTGKLESIQKPKG